LPRASPPTSPPREGTIRNRHGLTGVRDEGGTLLLETAQEAISAGYLLSCGGLQSDRIAAMTEKTLDLRILPFRGRWSILRPGARHGPRMTTYPVPDPRYPFLGVHFTRRMDGSVWVGPNATLAMSREDYGGGPRRLNDLASTLAWPGFWRMAARNFRHGASELWKDRVASASLAAARLYIPGLERGDLLPGPCGIRAQAVGKDGRLADDFEFREGRRALHVINAPSPAATASLAIAREIADRAEGPLRASGR
jgi:L-2-hydroxyglutarate oxidase LhgO